MRLAHDVLDRGRFFPLAPKTECLLDQNGSRPGPAIAVGWYMFKLPRLPYSRSELAPFLSEEQMRVHYEKHHGKYIENVNNMIRGNTSLEEKYIEDLILDSNGPLFNNAAQAWNHTFFWLNLAPVNSTGAPSDQFMQSCQETYGSLDDLFSAFFEAGEKVFGSGWVWLCADHNDKFHIITTPNSDVPWKATTHLRPLMLADVWEHAYYVDYQNQRRVYLEAMRPHVNWNFINKNLKARYMKSLHREMISDIPEDPQVSQAV